MARKIRLSEFRVLEYIREHKGVTVGEVKEKFGVPVAVPAITALGFAEGLIRFLHPRVDGEFLDPCPLEAIAGKEFEVDNSPESPVALPTRRPAPPKKRRLRPEKTEGERRALNARQLTERHRGPRTPRWS